MEVSLIYSKVYLLLKVRKRQAGNVNLSALLCNPLIRLLCILLWIIQTIGSIQNDSLNWQSLKVLFRLLHI